ncbi:CotH kinase family protein [Micromonospora echinospora]|uniref:CotH kinase family protein n=1 Tax=Micromonospora echinospora TaxID=1877 RepID=UPI0033D119F4
MPALQVTPGRRLIRRIPVRVRHHWKLLAGCVAFGLVLTVVFSTVRVQPYVTSSSDVSSDEVTQDIAGTRDLFDPTVAHDISLTFRDADYQRMLDTYAKEGEKEYVEASLTIDGTRIASVGVRLKGNSTLGGLTRDGESIGGLGGRRGGPGGPADGNGRPADGPPGGVLAPGGVQAQSGGAPDAGAGNPRTGGGRARMALKAEEPETLPWLIRFDEFVDGRRYQGHREIAVRVGGIGGGSTVLNEAVSLRVLHGLGESAPRYAYASFQVNDRPATVRLVVEHPGENLADSLGGSGVLYKSLATSQFTDQGDDPIDYQDDFNQVTKKGSQDLQPVIDLLKWVQHSSDAEFDAELAGHVDVESFARYVALQNLLLNFDDMAGPGRNYYLWYDLKTKKFTVVGWDYNLTFSGNAAQGPHDASSISFPGGGLPAGMQLPGGVKPPAGMQLPEGMQLPGGVSPPDGEAGAGNGGERAGGPRGGMGSHKLKDRFLTSAKFKPVYEDAYRKLYHEVYVNGTASKALEDLTRVLGSIDGHDAKAIASEAEQLRTLIQQRTARLADNEVVKG